MWSFFPLQLIPACWLLYGEHWLSNNESVAAVDSHSDVVLNIQGFYVISKDAYQLCI